jgi:hypothetical protein
MPMVAWYVLSNVSYMNLSFRIVVALDAPASRAKSVNSERFEAHRVMSDVFPTDWSPSRTIFVRFNGDDEKSAVVGVPAFDMIVYVG